MRVRSVLRSPANARFVRAMVYWFYSGGFAGAAVDFDVRTYGYPPKTSVTGFVVLWRGIPVEITWPVRADSCLYQFRRAGVNNEKSLYFANDRIRVRVN